MAIKGSPWSEKEIETLREMAGKFTSTEIGKTLGRGSEGVKKMIKKFGLPSWVPPVKEKPIPEPPKPVEAPVRLRTWVESKEGLRQAPKPKERVSYPPLEWCPTCHSPVSNWDDHRRRMGCERPAA